MRGFLASVFTTAQVILFALLPPSNAGEEPSLPTSGPSADTGAGALRCAPRRIRGGMNRLLDGRGELRLFFPQCLAIAAPALLFRLKREGFSVCSVEASEQGLLVRGRR